MKSRYLFLSIILIGIATFSGVLTRQLAGPPLAERELQELAAELLLQLDRDSVLSPLTLNSGGLPPYPHVTHAPTDPWYRLVLLKEEQERQPDPLFLAHKRLAELLAFHDQLPRAVWEKQLLIYQSLILKELAQVAGATTEYAQNRRYLEALHYVRQHQRDLTQVLLPEPEQSLADQQVEQLALVNAYFAAITQKFPSYLVESDTQLYYPLAAAAERLYGPYQLQIRTAASVTGSAQLRARFGGQSIIVTPASIASQGARTWLTPVVQIRSANDRFELWVDPQATAAAWFRPVVTLLPAPMATPEGRVNLVHRGPAPQLELQNLPTKVTQKLADHLGQNWQLEWLPTPDHSLIRWQLQPRWQQLGWLLTFTSAGLALAVLGGGWLSSVRWPRRLKLSADWWLGWRRRLLALAHWLRRWLSPWRLLFLALFWVLWLVDVVILTSTQHRQFGSILLGWWLFIGCFYPIKSAVNFGLGFLLFWLLAPLLWWRKDAWAAKLASWLIIFWVVGIAHRLWRTAGAQPNWQEEVQRLWRQLWVDLHGVRQLSARTWTWLGQKPASWYHTHAGLLSGLVFLSTLAWVAWQGGQQYQYYVFYYRDQAIWQFGQAVLLPLLLVLMLVLINLGLLAWRHRRRWRWLFLFGCGAALLIQHRVFMVATEQLRAQVVITRLSRESGPMWSEVRISGNNFGDAPFNQARVMVGGKPQRVLRWSNQEVIFVVDPINTPTGQLWVVNPDGKESNRRDFVYQPL